MANCMNVKDKILELKKVLDDLDTFDEQISSNLQMYDWRISDLYHYLEDMHINSKNSYRFCKELKSVLNERRVYKNNLSVYSDFKKKRDRMFNGKGNRDILVNEVCKYDKVLKNSTYSSRVYNQEELKEKMEG